MPTINDVVEANAQPSAISMDDLSQVTGGNPLRIIITAYEAVSTARQFFQDAKSIGDYISSHYEPSQYEQQQQAAEDAARADDMRAQLDAAPPATASEVSDFVGAPSSGGDSGTPTFQVGNQANEAGSY